jgi:hypothetical protein
MMAVFGFDKYIADRGGRSAPVWDRRPYSMPAVEAVLEASEASE